jgi:predicted secreted protein
MRKHSEYKFTVVVKQTTVIVILLIILCGSAFFCGKSSDSDTSKTIKESVQKVFTKDDNGIEYDIPKGEIFEIELQTNPSTGYDWHFDSLDTDMVEIVESYTTEISLEKRIGAPVKKTWVLKTKKSGMTTVTMNLYRSWQGVEKAIQTFEVKLNITS